jgi:hypothetical protein
MSVRDVPRDWLLALNAYDIVLEIFIVAKDIEVKSGCNVAGGYGSKETVIVTMMTMIIVMMITKMTILR